jgi:hypothetical protein
MVKGDLTVVIFRGLRAGSRRSRLALNLSTRVSGASISFLDVALNELASRFQCGTNGFRTRGGFGRRSGLGSHGATIKTGLSTLYSMRASFI